jgi:hypothetical protein
MSERSNSPHITCLKVGQNIEDVFSLTPCVDENCDFKCKGKIIHCPICLTDKFKPARLTKVLAHLNKTHFYGKKGVCESRGFLITKCHLPCRKKGNNGHFHCPLCHKTFVRKEHLLTHCASCSTVPTIAANNSNSHSSDEDNNDISNNDVCVSPTSTEPRSSVENEMDNSGHISNNDVCVSPTSTEPSSSVENEMDNNSHILPDDHNDLSNENCVEGTSGEHSRDIQACTYCNKFYSKTYLKIHTRRKHLQELNSGENLSKSHYSVCVDTNLGIYAVTIRNEGPQTPLHVLFRSFGPNQKMECSRNKCMDLWGTEARSGKNHFMCEHVESVRHNTITATYHELSKEKLQEMTDSRFISISRSNQLTMMLETAKLENIPMVAFIPTRETYSERFRWYSVYSYTNTQHYWCKFYRVIITLDTELNSIKCKCKKISCIHSSVVKWFLYEKGENFNFQVCDEDICDNEANTESISQSMDHVKNMVDYIHTVKSITNEQLLKINFNANAIPSVLEPKETHCYFCQVLLDDSKPSLRPVILCNDRKPITSGTIVKTRSCRKCSAIYKYREWEHGIFNFDNKLFISLPFLLDIRYGLTTHTAISRTVESISRKLKVNFNEQKVRYAYLAFEALVKHKYSFYCLHCGIHPKTLVYDVCKKVAFDFDVEMIEKDRNSTPTIDADIFWETVEKNLIARTMIERDNDNPFKIPLSYSNWAPFIGHSTRKGHMLYNTEYSKVTVTEDEDLISEPIPDELLTQLLQHNTTIQIKTLCEHLNVSTGGNRYEMLERLRQASVKRSQFDKYYSKIVNRSGGWLTASCPHNVIYAAKFLFRSESPVDYLNIMKSFKYQPTVSIIDIANRVASLGNKMFPGMFAKNNGRLLPTDEANMLGVEQNKLTISIPALQNDIPITNPTPEQHPITGLDYSFCLFDYFHQCNSKLRPELLRRSSIVTELAGYINTQSAEQTFTRVGKDIYWLNMLKPINHMFCFRLMCQFTNDDINDKHKELHMKSLKDFKPAFNNLGQLVRYGCTPHSVQSKDYSVKVMIKERQIYNCINTLEVDNNNVTRRSGSCFLNYDGKHLVKKNVTKDENSMFRAACIAHSNFTQENYETLRRDVYEWCLQNRGATGCNDTEIADLGVRNRYVVKNVLTAVAQVMCCTIHVLYHIDKKTIDCDIYNPLIKSYHDIYLYLDLDVDHYDLLFENGSSTSINEGQGDSSLIDQVEGEGTQLQDVLGGEISDNQDEILTVGELTNDVESPRTSTSCGRPSSPVVKNKRKKKSDETNVENDNSPIKVRGHVTRSKTGHKIGPKRRYSPPNFNNNKRGIYRKKVGEGPSYQCVVCLKTCSTGSTICCSYCKSWEHWGCRNLKGNEKCIKSKKAKWKCLKCQKK